MSWWLLAADATVIVHFAFILLVIFGGFLAWRWRGALFVHLPALAWGMWIELTGRICPLTPLENHLRELAGSTGYRGDFIEHYILPVIYPPGLTRNTQWVLAAVLVVINLIAYGGLIVRSRNRASIRQ
jgi:hypothetical protein